MIDLYDFVRQHREMLSREEEVALFANWKTARDSGDTRTENKLMEQIVIQYSPVVASMVKKMKGYRMDPNELTAEGMMGLTKAVIDFDPDRGFRFGTYALRCVMTTLYTFVTKHYFITNVCSNSKHKKVFFGLRRHMAQQMKDTGVSELSHEMAEKLAETMEVDVDIIKMMAVVIRDPYASLSQKVNEDDESVTGQDLLVSDGPTQDDLMEEKQLRVLQAQLINGALDRLDDRSRRIVKDSVLVENDQRATLEDLGKIFSISKERVRQLRERATNDIRQHIRHELLARGFTPSDILPFE